MENASKALIIAGAILISIVLITLGVIILQQGNSTTGAGETALNSREIESFNSQFQQYQGETVSGTRVRALINAINSNNAAQFNNGGGHYILLTGTTSITSVKPASTYKVTSSDAGVSERADDGTLSIKDGSNPDGYIDTITITAN